MVRSEKGLDKKPIIFGIDISRGSPKSKTPPFYALVILHNSKVEKLRMLSRYKVLQIIHQYKPDILATDNIYELVPDKKELLKLLHKLPNHTRVVQVTGGRYAEKLPALAQRYGIKINRLDPADEALACALLAERGVGSVLEVFESKTRVVVTRARSLGRGGWSQNRYRRKVHSAVRAKIRETEDKLKEHARAHKIDYTLKITRGYGGYSRGEFIIQTPPEQLKIKNEHTADVQVKVEKIEKDNFKFTPLARQKHPYIIAGIDPGTTAAIAVLGLEGELLHLESSRTTSIADNIETLSHVGRPLIIATDVNRMPHTLEKIRRTFNAKPSTPTDSLSTEEKIELTQNYHCSNTHERDALAAALHAYNKYKHKFLQAEKKATPNTNLNEIKAKIIKGEPITTPPQKTSPPPKTTEEETRKKPNTQKNKTQARTHKRQEQIKILKEYINDLQGQITDKDLEIKKLENKIKNIKTKTHEKLKKDKELQIKNKKIKQLKTELQQKNSKIRQLTEKNNKINQMRQLEMKGRATPIKVIQSFTKESIQQTKNKYNLKKGDIILLLDASGGGPTTSDLLAQMEIGAVIISNEMSHAAEEQLFAHNIPVFSTKQIHIKRENDFAIAKTEDIQKLTTQWQKQAEKHRHSQKQEWLQHLLQEYQSERKKQHRKQQTGDTINGVENR